MRHINQVEEQVKPLNQAYEEIETLLNQPFSEEILTIKASDGFKMPAMEVYDGLSGPTDHLCRSIAHNCTDQRPHHEQNFQLYP